MCDELDRMVEAIVDGRALNENDLRIVRIVASLMLDAQQAGELVKRDGVVIDEGKGGVPHPALLVQKQASAELQGWVKVRPDLFGEQKQAGRARGGLRDFKVI